VRSWAELHPDGDDDVLDLPDCRLDERPWSADLEDVVPFDGRRQTG
jgi:hypothetical protein